ncbi:MAG TPA: DUF488 domain-containing protein [Ktedonobacteraceae bacterium]|nr:DUF488 domain-containing protein [Ktedonobacteraceae bacterium]
MTTIPIYTIGYGNRSIEEFVELLQRYDMKFLVDIRSQPYSRYNPDFSKDVLEKRLKQASIRYIFMGDTLGGRPSDDTVYLEDGRVDYEKVAEKDFYQKGISYLHTAWNKQLRTVLMCSEAKPQACHRSKLIGKTLRKQNIAVAHIDETGAIKSQEQVDLLLTDGQLTLFDDMLGLSRKKHTLPGEEA